MVCCASSPDGKARVYGPTLWLLLLSIFTHAFVPLGSPLDRGAGSAFSISTGEVSLAAKKRNPIKNRQAQIRAADDIGPDGAGATAYRFVSPAAGQFTPPPSAEPAGSIARPPAVFASQRGAAPFSARAPPAL